jgi:arylsulfatase A-like enzyme
MFDRGLGVMLILRGPGGFSGGKVNDALVSHLDIYPTVCELAGIERPDFLQGESLMPLVRRETTSIRDALFAEMTWHAAYEPQRAVRTERWKYIRRFGDRTKPVLANCDDSPSKSLLLAHGWGERTIASEQLYDLVFDPNEAANLAGEQHCAATLGDMRDRLQAWMVKTDDPLLRGDPTPPPGAEVNDPDQVSASEPRIRIG